MVVVFQINVILYKSLTGRTTGAVLIGLKISYLSMVAITTMAAIALEATFDQERTNHPLATFYMILLQHVLLMVITALGRLE